MNRKSINSKIEKFVKLLAEEDREFIPPDLHGGESSGPDGGIDSAGGGWTTTTDILCECAHEVTFDEWIQHPLVKGAVTRECTSCATNWTPTCDCIAKGVVSGNWQPSPQTGGDWANDIGASLRHSPLGPIVEVCLPMHANVPCPRDPNGSRSYPGKCCSFIRFNGGCFPNGDAFDFAYTKQQWLGSASAPTMGGIWVSYYERCRQSGHSSAPSAEEFLASCTANQNCMEEFVQFNNVFMNLCGGQIGAAASIWTDTGPTKYTKMLFDNCTSSGGACCSPAGDFGGFECSQANSAAQCNGTFHPGKQCSEIGGDNCGASAKGSVELKRALVKALKGKP
jgi:hypothetical protein